MNFGIKIANSENVVYFCVHKPKIKIYGSDKN